MGGFYILLGSILEKCGKFRKNGRFSGRTWPDWGNAARADLAGWGSIGLNEHEYGSDIWSETSAPYVSYTSKIMVKANILPILRVP